MDARGRVDDGPFLDDPEAGTPVFGQGVVHRGHAGFSNVIIAKRPDVILDRPDRQTGRSAAVDDLDGELLGDQRHRLLFHIDETRSGRNHPERFARDQHDPAWACRRGG